MRLESNAMLRNARICKRIAKREGVVCRQLAGKNSHHIVEATFKAFARALRRATEVDERRAGQIASSKGVLTQH